MRSVTTSRLRHAMLPSRVCPALSSEQRSSTAKTFPSKINRVTACLRPQETVIRRSRVLAGTKPCLSYQVSQSILTYISQFTNYVIEVERAARLLKQFALGREIQKVETNEDSIVFSGTSHNDFVRV